MGFINRKRRQKQQLLEKTENQATVSRSTELPKISRQAKELAEANGIDWTVLTGTSASGMITIGDVQAKIEELTAAADTSQPIDLTNTVTPDQPVAKGVKGNGGIPPQ